MCYPSSSSGDDGGAAKGGKFGPFKGATHFRGSQRSVLLVVTDYSTNSNVMEILNVLLNC